MQKRELWKVIVLGIVTLGIYNLYWLYKTRNEMVARGADIPKFVLLFLPLIIVVGVAIFSLIATAAGAPGDGNSAAGAVSTLVMLLTILAWIPIAFYWYYKYCKAVEQVTGGRLSLVLNFIMLIVLGAIGLGFLWPALVQDAFNKTS